MISPKTIYRYKLAKKYLRGKSVLDVGCGKGRGLYLLKGFNIVGVDPNKNDLNIAKKENLNAKFIYGFVPPIKFPDNSFDNIVCVGVIQHINSKKIPFLIKEFYRVLKPNGKLILTTPNAENTKVKLKDHKEFTRKEIEKFLGFVPFKILFKGGYYLPFLVNLDRTKKTVDKISNNLKNIYFFEFIAHVIWKIQLFAGELFPLKAKYQTWICEKY